MCKGPQQHEEASLGLLYIILVEPAAAAKVSNESIFFVLLVLFICHVESLFTTMHMSLHLCMGYIQLLLYRPKGL